jgi:membrane-associated protease RseP (regulator of RpoE activity)
VEIVLILGAGVLLAATLYVLNRARPVLTYVAQVVHESGHYLALRLFGVRPIQFRIGDNRLMCRYTAQKTVFSFHLNTENSTVVVAGDDIRRLFWWQRLVVYAAGVVFNLAFGLAAVVLVYWYFGFAHTTLEIVAGFILLYLVLELLSETSLVCFDCLQDSVSEGRQTDGSAIREILASRFSR